MATNCINCKWNWQFDKNMQCKRANEKEKNCPWFQKVERAKD